MALSLPAEGQILRNALRLLQARDVPAVRVVAVDCYGITFCDRDGGVRTAWTWRERLSGGQERLSVMVDDRAGLPAFPAEHYPQPEG